MSKHRIFYKKKKRHTGAYVVAVLGLLAAVAGIYGYRMRDAEIKKATLTDEVVLYNRLERSEIPEVSIDNIRYAELFADMNDVQLATARKIGLSNPERIDDPSKCQQLQLVQETKWYAIDTLRHSKPYLVPEGALLLRYIGERYADLQREYGVQRDVRPIVTSMLRSKTDVRRLRRVNRNATENSCHEYGTTFDLSYTRFMTDEGEVVTDDAIYKKLLAKALYELRYEGLCYVKYERRQPCFHITVRKAEYDGPLACEMKQYKAVQGAKDIKSTKVNASTDRQLTKAEDSIAKTKVEQKNSVVATTTKHVKQVGNEEKRRQVNENYVMM